MISLRTIEAADEFVEKVASKGVDVRWNGWDMVFHSPDPAAQREPEGRFSRITSQWGIETVVSPNSDGVWLVNYKFSRGTPSARR